MTQQWRPWLPVAAFERLDVRQDVESVVTGWSERWWSGDCLRSVEPEEQEGAEPSVVTRRTASGLMIRVAPSILLAGLFGRDVPTEPGTAADERLLDALSEAALDDLRRSLLGAVRLDPAEPFVARAAPADSETDGDLAVRFRGRDACFLEVRIGESTLIGLIKAELDAAPTRPKLYRLAAAVEVQAVPLTGALGRCEINVSDLRGLALGDILIFDTTVEQTLPLIIDGPSTTVATGRLTRTDTGLALALQ